MKLWLQLAAPALGKAIIAQAWGHACQTWPLEQAPPAQGLLVLDQIPPRPLPQPWVFVGNYLSPVETQQAYAHGALAAIDAASPASPLPHLLACLEANAGLGLGQQGAELVHDLNNLLFAALLNLRLAQTWAQPPLDKPNHLERLDWALQQMEVQLKSALQQARGHRSEAQPFQPDPLLNVVLQVLQAETPPQVTLVTQQTGPDARVLGQASLFVNLVWNLVVNAFAALSSQGGQIRLHSQQMEGEYRLVICDNGPGLPPERALAPFAPGPSAKGLGHGWGLAQAKEAAIALGGDLTWSPGQPQGCCFALRLPCIPAAQQG